MDIITRHRGGRISDPAALSRIIGNNLQQPGVRAALSFMAVLAFPEYEACSFCCSQ